VTSPTDGTTDEPTRDGQPPAAPAEGRLVLVGGGAPKPEELAALVLALTATGAAAPAGGAAGAPAWRLAGIIEATGQPRVTRPTELVRHLGHA
jgi:hypothetical protein